MKIFKKNARVLSLLLIALLTLSLFTGCGEAAYDAAMKVDAQIKAEEEASKVESEDQSDATDPQEDETENFDTDDPESEISADPEEPVQDEQPVENERPAEEETPVLPEDPEEDHIDPDGVYTSKEDVAEYLWTWGELPKNFITKGEARKLGWEGGSLEPFDPGKCIGGDKFGNREGILPKGDYRECDIDTLEAEKRGAKRLVYTADCSRIYYTDDHYESFTLLYGEE